jgi:hypothetical protein
MTKRNVLNSLPRGYHRFVFPYETIPVINAPILRLLQFRCSFLGCGFFIFIFGKRLVSRYITGIFLSKFSVLHIDTAAGYQIF